MSHFSIDYSDFDSPDSVFKAIAKNQKNPITTTPLTSSGSESGDPQFLTTASIADIQQGTFLYKPRGMILDNQEAALSRAFQGYIEHPKGGRGDISNVISAGTAPFIPPSIRSVIGETPQGMEQIDSINAAIANGATSGGSSGDLEYHEPPNLNAMHKKVTHSGVSLYDNPGVMPYPWRLIARLKDSEIKPPDMLGISNGEVPNSMLTTFNKYNEVGIADSARIGRLWTPAAIAMKDLMDAANEYGFRGAFMTDSYRSWQVQNNAYHYWEDIDPATGKPYHPGKQGLINPAGTSNHGFGIAVDLHEDFRYGHASGKYGDDKTLSGLDWMYLNSWRFGWVHPEWALPFGFHPEDWHWEYRGHLYKWYNVSKSGPDILFN